MAPRADPARPESPMGCGWAENEHLGHHGMFRPFNVFGHATKFDDFPRKKKAKFDDLFVLGCLIRIELGEL